VEVCTAVRLMVNSLKAGGKVLAFGVGGNAANAMHFSAELSGKYESYEDPLACICLCDNPSVLTAITNDFGWEFVFSRQIKALAKPGDVVFTLSISTKGKYLVNAIQEALKTGCEVVLICGDNTLDFKDPHLHVLQLDSGDTPWVQESQLVLIHEICGKVKAKLSST
jgi:D-sedoheptulose 7-phosphate isomerase